MVRLTYSIFFQAISAFCKFIWSVGLNQGKLKLLALKLSKQVEVEFNIRNSWFNNFWVCNFSWLSVVSNHNCAFCVLWNISHHATWEHEVQEVFWCPLNRTKSQSSRSFDKNSDQCHNWYGGQNWFAPEKIWVPIMAYLQKQFPCKKIVFHRNDLGRVNNH